MDTDRHGFLFDVYGYSERDSLFDEYSWHLANKSCDIKTTYTILN